MASTQAAAPEVQATPIAPAAPVDQAPQAGQVQVNVDFLKTTRVHICMPCYGGMLLNLLLCLILNGPTQLVS